MNQVSLAKWIVSLGMMLLLMGCATTDINPRTTHNPPPEVKFSEFSAFELKPVILAAEYQGRGANDQAAQKIDREIRMRLVSVLQEWSNDSDSRSTTRDTLIIQPRITDLKFISGGARFWAGAMAGSSAVIMEVDYIDARSGDIVAQPEFYQHASAQAGSWSIGAADNAMLDRVAELVANYTRDNFSEAVGGRSGAPADRVR